MPTALSPMRWYKPGPSRCVVERDEVAVRAVKRGHPPRADASRRGARGGSPGRKASTGRSAMRLAASIGIGARPVVLRVRRRARSPPLAYGRSPPLAASSLLVNGTSVTGRLSARYAAHGPAPFSTPSWNARIRSNALPCACRRPAPGCPAGPEHQKPGHGVVELGRGDTGERRRNARPARRRSRRRRSSRPAVPARRWAGRPAQPGLHGVAVLMGHHHADQQRPEILLQLRDQHLGVPGDEVAGRAVERVRLVLAGLDHRSRRWVGAGVGVEAALDRLERGAVGQRRDRRRPRNARHPSGRAARRRWPRPRQAVRRCGRVRHRPGPDPRSGGP